MTHKKIPLCFKKVFLKMQKEGPLEICKAKGVNNSPDIYYTDVLDCKKKDILVITPLCNSSSKYDLECKNAHNGDKIEISYFTLCALLHCNVCKIIKIETNDADAEEIADMKDSILSSSNTDAQENFIKKYFEL